MIIFHKNDNFRRINAKINKLFKNIYPNIPAEFESDWCSLYRVIAKKKIDKLHTQTHTHTHTHKHTHTLTHTHTHTHTYIFVRRVFFQCWSYISKKNRDLTTDFWPRFKALLNQRLRKQNWYQDLIYRPNFFWKL